MLYSIIIKVKTNIKIIYIYLIIINIKPTSWSKNKTDHNSLNISKNLKLTSKKDKISHLNVESESKNLFLQKSNTSKIFNIKIKKCHNKSKNTKKLGNPNINNFSIKTNINSPIGSDRDEKQIISLNHELKNKNNEIDTLKKRIDEQNKYITELEDKIKCIIDNKIGGDIELEQYSKKMIVRNIKVLTTENEELHKQIDEYKERIIAESCYIKGFRYQ